MSAVLLFVVCLYPTIPASTTRRGDRRGFITESSYFREQNPEWQQTGHGMLVDLFAEASMS